jgi:hypothetical protein
MYFRDNDAQLDRTRRVGLYRYLIHAVALLCASTVFAAGTRDQGQIFGTGGVVDIPTDTLAQSITAGRTGQLTGIQIQWNAPIPAPEVLLDLAIVEGSDPLRGKTLYTEQVRLDPVSNPDDSLFTWDLTRASLFFEAGDRFSFTLSANRAGLVIAGNDPPGYARGVLSLNGDPLPTEEINDIAFITFVAGEGGEDPSSAWPGEEQPADEGRDQGRIFGTGDTVGITPATLSQSITAGRSGQLTAIQMQWNAEVPAAAPKLFLAIYAGGNPPTGQPLYSETLDLGAVQDGDVFTWDLTGAGLSFEAGDRFTFALRADGPGFVIAANDPPGYSGGELYEDGKARPQSLANDIAFITYVDQPNPPHPGSFTPPPTGMEPEWEPPQGLVIAANDPPGYPGGELYRNGLPAPAGSRHDIAFITFMAPPETPAVSTRDQGRIFGTDGMVALTSDNLAQSITVGIAGQLTGIRLQWNADIPDPAPRLNMAIVAGGNPATGKILYAEQIVPEPSANQGLFDWNLRPGELYFDKGERFTLTLSTVLPMEGIKVASVRDIGVVENPPGVVMRDCGYSARYRGRSVWFFGDTILENPNEDDLTLLCNSWSVTTDIDAEDGLASFEAPVDGVGASVPFIPLTAEEEAFNRDHANSDCGEPPCGVRWAIWPGTIVVDEQADVAYVFYHKVYLEGAGFKFIDIGHSIAVWENFEQPLERPEFGYYEDYPTLFFSEERDGFGSAAVLVDRKLYVYGCHMVPDDIFKPCRVARVDIDSILDRDSWEFFHGQGLWSSSLQGAARVFRGNNMMTVFYNEYLSRYVVVYSMPLGTEVAMRVADSPEGPWSEPLTLFSGITPESRSGWIYDALAHPEFSADGKTLYITYSRQTGPGRSEFRLVAIELALDPAAP